MLKYLVLLKKKISRLILHWKISVSLRDLKSVLCIQELDFSEYTLLSVSLRPSPLFVCVCVLKYLVFFKKKKVISVREIGIHAYNKAYYHLHEAH